MLQNDSRKVLTVGLLAGWGDLANPAETQDVESLFVIRQLAEPPYIYQPGSLELQPALFEGDLEWDPIGRKTARARLRNDLLFSDETPVTPDCVVDCLSQVPLLNEQAEISAEGFEISFRLLQDNARFAFALSLPQCAIYRKSDRLLGTGPYRLVDESRPGRIRLERNPHYRDEVAIDEIQFQQYADTAALVRGIEEGHIDFTNSLPREEIKYLTNVGKSLATGISTAILYFNKNRIPERETRQALAHSINRQEIARSLFKSDAYAAESVLPLELRKTASRGIDRENEFLFLTLANDRLSYDPQLAQQLLSRPQVQVPTHLTMLMMWAPRPYLPDPERVLRLIQQQLRGIGVRVTPVRTGSPEEFKERAVAGQEDMVLAGWVADVIDEADFLQTNLASSRIPSSGQFSVHANFGRLASESLDQALVRYRATRNLRSLEEVIEILSHEAPFVPLTYGTSDAVCSRRVSRFKNPPLGIFPLSELDLLG